MNVKTKFENFEKELDDLILHISEKYGFDYLDFNMHTPKEGLRDITKSKAEGETENTLYSLIEYKDNVVGTMDTNDFLHKKDDEEVWGIGIFRGNKPENRFMRLMKNNGIIRVGCALRRIKST